MTLVALEDVRTAAERVRGKVVRTPLLPCPWADDDRPLWLKPENLQPTGAFKLRGALSALGALSPDERRHGVITHSSGNHGRALAWAARSYGVPVVVVMPDTSPPIKIDGTRRLGAEIVIVPASEREARVAAISAERALAFIPPFDHAEVIAGQGTVGLEIVADLADVDTVLVPVGGGGLISGVAVAVKALTAGTRVLGVEPELAGDLAEGFRRGERVVWDTALTSRTIADGVRLPAVGELAWRHIAELVDDVVTVSEQSIVDAMALLARASQIVAEPSGALTTAAYFEQPNAAIGRTVAVVSGGNVDPALLAQVLVGADRGINHSS
ncbi:MAG TPA: threonine/serine dehydratase [Jiangellaceae bacterium]|jgi:threonine dehydratase|nr:threonine/serine dehydratase [Jiangellaceae bacterium]